MACIVWDSAKYGISYDAFLKGIETTKRNSTWLYDMWYELKEKYQDKWVAVYDTEIVGVSESQETLINQIREKSIPLNEVEIRFITAKDIIEIL